MIIKQDFRKMRTSYQVLYMVYWIFLLYMDRHSYTVIYLQTFFFQRTDYILWNGKEQILSIHLYKWKSMLKNITTIIIRMYNKTKALITTQNWNMNKLKVLRNKTPLISENKKQMISSNNLLLCCWLDWDILSSDFLHVDILKNCSAKNYFFIIIQTTGLPRVN